MIYQSLLTQNARDINRHSHPDILHSLRSPLTGEQLKAQGMKRAAEARARMLSIARWCASCYARANGTCTADDATQYFTPLMRESLGNAAGSIFTGKEWRHTGMYRKSVRASNRARVISVWRLK